MIKCKLVSYIYAYICICLGLFLCALLYIASSATTNVENEPFGCLADQDANSYSSAVFIEGETLILLFDDGEVLTTSLTGNQALVDWLLQKDSLNLSFCKINVNGEEYIHFSGSRYLLPLNDEVVAKEKSNDDEHSMVIDDTKFKEKVNTLVIPEPELPRDHLPTHTDTKDSIDAHAMGQEGLECIIDFMGLNQPKVGYRDDCTELNAQEKREQIIALMGGFPDDYFVTHKAKDEKSEIYVFTDYTCPFCQKLHKNLNDFLDNGITVHYVFYPRHVSMAMQDQRFSSKAEEVVLNMGSAWCSEDQVAAVDMLFKEQKVPFAKCSDDRMKSPVRQHFLLGMMFDITGTPLIVGKNGATSYGFSSALVSINRLGLLQ